MKAREDLLAIVSHDLKNPLSVIQMSTSGLLTQPPEDLAARARKQVEAIERSSARMASLITNILEETEKHIDFLETELELVQKVGLQNYLQTQIGEGPSSS